MITYLSYEISSSNPVYGKGNKKIGLRQIKSLSEGDSCQTYWIGIENHLGTHVDCPAHFFSRGKKIVDYPSDFWFFRRPQILTIKAKPGQIIDARDIDGKIEYATDLLIFKSGWSKLRKRLTYCIRNPGMAPQVALYFREHYPRLKAIGIDWISISSYENRELGREAHREFLNPNGKGHAILIIEEMRIPQTLSRLKTVWVAPLRVEAVDSAPVTIIGIS